MIFATPLLLGSVLAGGATPPVPKTAAPDACSFSGARDNLAARPSPLDSASAPLGNVQVKVCYGRPSARGEPWRLGANEAATLHVPVAVRFGDVSLKPGVYSLYAIPGAKTWQLVVNDSATRWGIPINAAVRARDVGAVTAAVEPTDAPVETLTMRWEPAGDGALALVTEWERTRVRVTVRRAP
jgi:hypothetical protein